MIMLGLDLATNTGFCHGDGSCLPTLGHYRIKAKGADVGEYLDEFEVWLAHLLDRVQPDLVCFEAPVLPRLTNPTTVRKLNGLANAVELACFRRRKTRPIECREASNSAAKKALTGKGNAKKHEMVAGARRLGLDPHTYTHDGEEASDEADAAGVWLTAVLARHPVLAAKFSPLFAGVA